MKIHTNISDLFYALIFFTGFVIMGYYSLQLTANASAHCKSSTNNDQDYRSCLNI